MPGYIGPPTYILGAKNIIVGKNVRIYPGIRLECHFGGRIIIGDDVSIAQNVHITSAYDDLIIHRGVVILANSFVTNIHHSYEPIDIPPSKRKLEFKKTEIFDNCFIGMGVAILPGVILGEGSVVGANSTVTKSFSKHSILAGSPAAVIKYISS